MPNNQLEIVGDETSMIHRDRYDEFHVNSLLNRSLLIDQFAYMCANRSIFFSKYNEHLGFDFWHYSGLHLCFLVF